VDVVFVCVDCFEYKLRIVFFDVLNSGHNEGLNALVYDHLSVFGRKHNVIVA